MKRGNRVLISTLLAAAMLLAGCTLNPSSPSATTTSPGMVGNSGMMRKTYTLVDIAKHADSSSCWMAIEGKVYDVTKFIGSHPGGEAILSGCGKDATAMFNSRPDGTSHSSRARSLLQEFYIGDLSQ